MTGPVVPDRALAELGRTRGGPDTLALLVRDQDTRRLLLLRAVLDAVDGADAALCAATVRRRLREDWALLTEADRVAPTEDGAEAGGVRTSPGGPAAPGPVSEVAPAGRRLARAPILEPASHGSDGGTPFAAPGESPSTSSTRASTRHAESTHQTPPGPPLGRTTPLPTQALGAGHAARTPLSPARARLLHPLAGPWARSCLRALGRGDGPATEQRARALGQGLAHFSALAAAAATRAGISFTVRLTARAGVLTLPSLGALRVAGTGDAPVDVVHRRGRLTLRQPGAVGVVVHLESGIGAWSSAPAWTPAFALPGMIPGAAPMPLDDLDPYRSVPGGPHHHGLSGPATLDDAERKRWLQAWSGTAAALRLGGEHRVEEVVALLRCLVPLEMPPGARADGRVGGSGTRREAFGALLSSTPPTALTFAATLVHEIQHTKLAALSDMVTLHRAGPQERYFAPWRPDPRPYDGLLQGTYSHLALADFFQRHALAASRPGDRDSAWALHARYREQVGAALPTLVGSPDLTTRGRRFVDRMVATYEVMAGQPVPRGHVARARAYVGAARALWTQRHAPAVTRPGEAE